MSGLEIISVLVATIGIAYTIIENRLCWLVNILASLLYIKVFNDSALPGQVLLQVIYIVVGVYGYIYWGAEDKVKVKVLGILPTVLLTIFSIISGYVIYKLSPGLIWADVSLTVGSIIATYLTTKKYIENWIFWLLINLVSIGLFIFRGLQLTAALYLAYALLSGVGYKQWAKQLK